MSVVGVAVAGGLSRAPFCRPLSSSPSSFVRRLIDVNSVQKPFLHPILAKEQHHSNRTSSGNDRIASNTNDNVEKARHKVPYRSYFDPVIRRFCMGSVGDGSFFVVWNGGTACVRMNLSVNVRDLSRFIGLSTINRHEKEKTTTKKGTAKAKRDTRSALLHLQLSQSAR